MMFRHVMGNDPRPHYFHQSNLADYNPALPETDTTARAASSTRSSTRCSSATRRRSTARSAPLMQLTHDADRGHAGAAERVGGGAGTVRVGAGRSRIRTQRGRGRRSRCR